ncbi:hypothetical protein Q31b_46990 [Novipirellula aureliae]|uniref:Glycosyl hydrolases family 43 n=1 Tax=Novipirellula aureliae TaxID=2527966 RepID=A0A5C6DM47_9BACT|nr:hypothetical protein [Novipirellula aureliae]TWU37910.1 hypothetical protein Q31b_46990 [Novipirellula aureliae]
MKNRNDGLLIGLLAISSVACAADTTWTIDSQAEWEQQTDSKTQLELKDGLVAPTAEQVTFSSTLKTFSQKRSAKSITIDQSVLWKNWDPISNIGPSNLGDAPVMLNLGPKNYWMFGLYRSGKKEGFVAKEATLAGFDIPLKTTPFKNQFNAPGGLEKSLGGYHAWQSKDMVNWVHHGPITPKKGKRMTTAEYVDGNAYFYYDFPNDQDPHLYIDEDLTDGKVGKDMGLAFKDPSDGSDCAFIRDLDGNFHVIIENWSPIDASTHAWDSPLADHAVSPDGIGDFKILSPAVDERTTPTGRFAEYVHPHWHKEDPENYPGRIATEAVRQHRVKKGDTAAYGTYEIHEPEQNAYGDWAAISIGGQYYLFSDFDPANSHGDKMSMSVAWFTSSSVYEPFTLCGTIGEGHPDPDIMFAEGKFYLATQTDKDFVSPGPWVERVEVRVGVDTDHDDSIDQWTDWQRVSEKYDYIPGFSKQVAKTPAQMDLSSLPAGYGFQFEVKMTDTTDNESKPILDKVSITFAD